VVLDSGAAFVPEAAEWVECAIIAEHAAGDHDIVVVEVVENHHTADHAPLIFHRSAFTGVRGVEALPQSGAK
jgi:flavin reductase (DIM6/NTAB) family NADH-FMN oxidoreductase RutF